MEEPTATMSIDKASMDKPPSTGSPPPASDPSRVAQWLIPGWKRGLKTIAQSPEASTRFVEGARSASLARMKERMEKSGGMENYDKVVNLFSPG